MRIYWPLVNLGMLFILPITGAAFCLSNLDRFHIHMAQHGSIISQPHVIAIDDPEYIVGTTVQNKWTLVYIKPSNTDLRNEQERILRKLHIALNKEQDRVSIVTIQKEALAMDIHENGLLILDPRGFAVMQYDDLTNHRGLLADLRRLLKYSHV